MDEGQRGCAGVLWRGKYLQVLLDSMTKNDDIPVSWIPYFLVVIISEPTAINHFFICFHNI
jgi:hypothetical protein